ncbi:copper resistance protein B [Pseudomonadota bacterium]
MKKIILLLSLLLPVQSFAMGDDAIFHSGMIDVDYESVDSQNVSTWDGSFWIGGDYDKLVFRARGERTASRFDHNELQLMWSHYIDPFWDVRAGFRHDWKPAKRNEAILALSGLAPYYIDTNLAVYIDRRGNMRGEIELAYDLQLTQQIVAELYIDSEWHGFTDSVQNLGTGISQYDAGIKLRYEFNRHVAVYLDLYTHQTIGQTRALLRAAGERTSQNGLRSGIRIFNF